MMDDGSCSCNGIILASLCCSLASLFVSTHHPSSIIIMALSASEGVLLGLGNPLLDMSADVGHAYLAKYDLKEGTALLAEPKHMPIYGELPTLGQVDYIAGGAAQNSMRVASWLLNKPKVAGYIGCVGNDDNAKILRKECEKAGVSVHYMEDASTATGTCAVLIAEKERTLCTNLGAANNYKISHYQTPEISAIVDKANVFYITGYFLTVSPDTIVEIGKHAAEKNKTFIFNLAAPFIIQFFTDALKAALPYVDIVFSNESEAAALGEKMGWGSDLHEIAKKLAGWDKVNKAKSRTVVFTQGAKATIVFRDDTITEFKPIPLAADKIVDLNGAGDSFVGGFLAGFVQSQPLEKCIDAGHYCACQVIQRSGCTLPEKADFSF
eukprot:TRINITY_DN273_c0_g1_i1.p1 TRINITY_DN273_c0_g1~~TRINITY_DN273_c0_g1_i1.p1  ORF type:complete len:381 (+),score=118.09 TRINITY_DN273_c0_g1_i1:8-1150(+)